jgi:hypothetical protein
MEGLPARLCSLPILSAEIILADCTKENTRRLNNPSGWNKMVPPTLIPLR